MGLRRAFKILLSLIMCAIVLIAHSNFAEACEKSPKSKRHLNSSKSSKTVKSHKKSSKKYAHKSKAKSTKLARSLPQKKHWASRVRIIDTAGSQPTADGIPMPEMIDTNRSIASPQAAPDEFEGLNVE